MVRRVNYNSTADSHRDRVMIHSIMLALGLLCAVDALPEARVVVSDGAAAVEIVGLDKALLAAIREAKPTAAELSKACKLVVGEGKPKEIASRPGVAGTWSVTETTIRFEPQFALVPGVKYLIACDP